MQKITYILFVLIFLAGCKVARTEFSGREKGISNDNIYLETILSKNITKKDFIIQRAEIQFNTKEEKEYFNAVIKYKHENVYLISIRSKGGIEAARIYVSKDTIMVNDRINKKLYYGSSVYLKEKYGISADNLALIFGDILYKKNTDKEKIECAEGEKKLTEIIDSIKIDYTIDCGLGKIKSAAIEKNGTKNRIEINYSDFCFENGTEYPGKITVESPNKEMQFVIFIRKAEFSEDVKINFIPGENYDRIRLQ